MTTVNLDVKLINAEGKEMKDATSGVAQDTSVRIMIRDCLDTGPMVYNPQRGTMLPDPSCTVADKVAMYHLSKSIKAAAEVELDSDDIVLIKRCISHLPPFILGQILEALGELKKPSKPVT